MHKSIKREIRENIIVVQLLENVTHLTKEKKNSLNASDLFSRNIPKCQMCSILK